MNNQGTISTYVLITADEYNALAELLRRTPVTRAEALAIDHLLAKWAGSLEAEVARASQAEQDHTASDQA